MQWSSPHWLIQPTNKTKPTKSFQILFDGMFAACWTLAEFGMFAYVQSMSIVLTVGAMWALDIDANNSVMPRRKRRMRQWKTRCGIGVKSSAHGGPA